MKRPIVSMASIAFTLGAAALSTPFFIAVIDHPSGQDTPVWLTLGTLSLMASAVASQSYALRVTLSTKALVLRVLLYCVLVLPAAFLFGAFTSSPP